MRDCHNILNPCIYPSVIDGMNIAYISSMVSPPFQLKGFLVVIPAGQGVFAWGGFSSCPYRVFAFKISQTDYFDKDFIVI